MDNNAYSFSERLIMPLHLVPRGLNYVDAVARHGSIQAASRAVGISASAIDRQIVLLEDRFGVQLFDRSSTGMCLSAAGELLIVLVRRWQADEKRILSDVKQLQGIDLGHMRIATMDSLVNGPIPSFLRTVAETFPKVRIDIEVMSPDSAVKALDSGETDIALAFNIRPQRDIHIVWSADLPLVCIVARDHALAACKQVTLKDIRSQTLVLQSRSLAIRRILEAQYSWILAEERPPVVTNSLQLMKQLVTEGSHVAITSQLDAARELVEGSLASLTVVDKGISAQSISVAISTRRTLPRIARVVAETLADSIQSSLDAAVTASK